MADTKHNMGEYYDRRASEYEQIYYRDIPPRQKELADEAERLKTLATGKQIVEIACGTGYWTDLMSQTAQKIIATDLSSEMIRQARQKQFSCPIEFIQADMYSLPVKSHACDLLAVGFWFSHEPKEQYPKFFDLLSSLIRPNGTIWMIDNNPPAEGIVNTSSGQDEHGNNYKKRYLDTGEEFTILKNYFTRDELQDIFSPHFTVKRITYGQYYWSMEISLK